MAPPPGRRPRPRCGGREEGRGRRGLYKARGGRRSFVFCCSNASGSPGAADWKRNFSILGLGLSGTPQPECHVVERRRGGQRGPLAAGQPP
ncbi:unnamed protein product [Rangifer tarandus platyrhynchus]|uniref:Uncharacterized protein n=1 Tax=Rangifer tarandus platyrhynchus TaxID=3082113 RepID=A0AC59ZWP0_RANTA